MSGKHAGRSERRRCDAQRDAGGPNGTALASAIFNDSRSNRKGKRGAGIRNAGGGAAIIGLSFSDGLQDNPRRFP
jgi:hypothetical protein